MSGFLPLKKVQERLARSAPIVETVRGRSIPHITNYVQSDLEMVLEGKEAFFEQHVQGQNLVEIGVGIGGGIGQLVPILRPQSYIGIDINLHAIEESRKACPDRTYLHADPVEVLTQAKEQGFVFSHWVCDLVRDEEYRNSLCEAIAKYTLVGGHTLHFGKQLHLFEKPLEANGFRRVEGFRGGYENILMLKQR